MGFGAASRSRNCDRRFSAHTHFQIPIIYPSHTHHWPMASYGQFIKYVMPDTTFRDRLCGTKLLWKVTVFLPSMFLKKIHRLAFGIPNRFQQSNGYGSKPTFVHPSKFMLVIVGITLISPWDITILTEWQQAAHRLHAAELKNTSR